MAARPPRVTSTRRQPTTRATKPRTGLSWWFNPGPTRPTTPTARSPAASAASAASAAAPAAPQYTASNLPPDASYDAQIATLQRQRDSQIAALTQARTSSLSDYGFTEGPNGALAFDPNNPFSKAAELKKTYDTSRRSTAQSLGAGGQLYSGAFQNAQDVVNRNQLQSEDSMQKALIRFLAQNTQGARDAGTNYELAAGQAAGDRVGRFQTNPLYDPAASAAASPVAAAASAAAAIPRGGYGTQQQRYAAARKRNPRGIWGR